MEYNMADKKTDTPAEVTAEQTPEQEIAELANRSSRSMIAVIDAVCQRGGFKGEELTTIGQLRDFGKEGKLTAEAILPIFS